MTGCRAQIKLIVPAGRFRHASLAPVMHGYGGPEVLKLEHVLGPEILIRVVAASINPADVMIRKGYLAGLVGKFPFVPGMDIAGS